PPLRFEYRTGPTLPGIGSPEVHSMDIMRFEMWLRRDSRNVAPDENDDTELINVPVEEFVAKYIRAENCKQQRNNLLEQLKSAGRCCIPVMRSKWKKMA